MSTESTVGGTPSITIQQWLIVSNLHVFTDNYTRGVNISLRLNLCDFANGRFANMELLDFCRNFNNDL